MRRLGGRAARPFFLGASQSYDIHIYVHGDGEEREARAPQEVGLQLVELVVRAVLLLVVPVEGPGGVKGRGWG